MKPILYIDIDDVLANFTSVAAELHQVTRSELERLRKPGVWSMQEILGLTELQFWTPILNKRYDFWISLPRLPWFDELMELVESYTDDWYLVSDPSSARCVFSGTGKICWCRAQFGAMFNRIVLTEHKHLLAKPGRILIDDRPSNCDKFVEEGGQAVLLPNTWNCDLHSAGDPIPHVTEALERLLCT